MTKKKNTKKTEISSTKQTTKISYSSDNMNSVWLFDKLDRNGSYAFDIYRKDFDPVLFLDKMISYSNMTWQQIKLQTHDKGNKSKNHFVEVEDLNKEIQDRIRALHYEEYSDSIFSFALQNLVRVFGIRENEFFHVVWYDPKHEIYTVEK